MSSYDKLSDSYFIKKLKAREHIKAFDCNDADLNEFILNEASDFRRSLLAVTYVLKTKDNPEKVAAFCSLANAAVALSDFAGKTEFNRFRRQRGIPNSKRMKTYPAIKVCRLGVDLSMRNYGAGTKLLNFVKTLFSKNPIAGCRFVTVDSYIDAIPFYEKNGFRSLGKDGEDFQPTKLMYFDLSEIV